MKQLEEEIIYLKAENKKFMKYQDIYITTSIKNIDIIYKIKD